MHLQKHLISSSQCISKFGLSWPPGASLPSLNNRIQVYLWAHSIVICRQTSNCSQAPPAASPDILCVDGYLYRYIESEMRIQTEYMSFKNRGMISSSYHSQMHQQCSHRRCCFSQTALLWFEVLSGLSSALPVLSPALRGPPRCIWRALHQSSLL